ncbi:DNA gyrase inhibitor YacG [Lampropedia aestuarii]|uniref:DNA gyrase inhibitor YacG n=1 Tax=Lampropedia aestuarii TaxID=2562762 RepID=A0A4V3YWV2_9BURK|nr:DNA gyrase inhibitor YacG [Lampropedia aestuarii]MDH5859029.1 DNA gyrase inhibitor YacG [Lampropedia aestuarii]THJ32762.1 DNA gyrase inhibitor YacG [Lampropedia aestuarii]
MVHSESSVSSATVVPCPQCQQPSVFAPSNRWRPFCSERCKLIDMGAWASESFRIQATPPALDEGTES